MRVRCATDDKWFDSIEEAAESYGVSSATILKSCKQPGRKAAGKLFHGDYGETYQKNFDDKFLLRQLPRTCVVRGKTCITFKDIGVRSVEDNLVFDSIEEAAEYYGYNCETLRCSIQEMRGIDKGKRHFHYVGDQTIQDTYDRYVAYIRRTRKFDMTLHDFEKLD